jgi:hypothetical protein
MKSLPASTLLILLVATGCDRLGPWHHPTIQGSGTLVTEERTVAGFDHVSLNGSGRLTIVQGDEESLTITTDDNLLEHIQSVVSGRRLLLGPERVSLRPSRPIEYLLRLKDLRRVDLSGSLSATSETLTTQAIALHISGSGNIRVGALEAKSCETHISGSGEVELAGHVVSQDLRVSGSGQYRAADLQSQTADVRISGSGKVTVWVSDQLDASISGSGSVSYYGTPTTSYSVSGSGKVRGLGARE